MAVTEAIILAGGRGERLRPLTDDRPKPMVQVGDYPLLYYTMLWLKQHGIKRVIVSCGYRHTVISDYFGNGAGFGLDIVYCVESQPLGRGGGIKFASQKLTSTVNPVLVVNGDVVTKLDLSQLLTQHCADNRPITLVAVPMRSPYGIIEIDESILAREFREKPVLPYWINAGIYVINASMLQSFPEVGDHEETLFPGLAAQGQLRAYQYDGFWSAIDTRKDLEELKKEESFTNQILKDRITRAS